MARVDEERGGVWGDRERNTIEGQQSNTFLTSFGTHPEGQRSAVLASFLLD